MPAASVRFLSCLLLFVTARKCGDFDCSIDDGYSLALPPENFVKRLGLKWTGKGADFIDEQGRFVAFDPTAYEDGADVLLIRKTP